MSHHHLTHISFHFQIGNKLRTWCQDMSWVSCPNCTAMVVNPMHPQMNILPNKWQTYPCKEYGTTNLPLPSTFPPQLHNLTTDDQELLSILSKDPWKYFHAKHDYRVKTSGFSTETKSSTVMQRIEQVSCHERKRRFNSAYSFFLQCPTSHCKCFIEMQDSCYFFPKTQFYDLFRIPYIETALWPILYFSDHLCKSSDSSHNPSKESRKRKFLWKCLSPIVDYSIDFSLLQFQFERWIYKIVSGTIDSARKYKVSPATPLDSKLSLTPTGAGSTPSCLMQ